MATITIDPKLKNWLIYTQGKEFYNEFLGYTMESHKNITRDKTIYHINSAFVFEDTPQKGNFWWDLSRKYGKNTDPIPEYIDEDDNNKIYYEYNF